MVAGSARYMQNSSLRSIPRGLPLRDTGRVAILLVVVGGRGDDRARSLTQRRCWWEIVRVQGMNRIQQGVVQRKRWCQFEAVSFQLPTSISEKDLTHAGRLPDGPDFCDPRVSGRYVFLALATKSRRRSLWVVSIDTSRSLVPLTLARDCR